MAPEGLIGLLPVQLSRSTMLNFLKKAKRDGDKTIWAVIVVQTNNGRRIMLDQAVALDIEGLDGPWLLGMGVGMLDAHCIALRHSRDLGIPAFSRRVDEFQRIDTEYAE